ncbi:MAG: pilus assembly protein PilP [Magnetococcales bacterium]|nr:pilus assembly protein PilP [Magnetococcales bacterium]
MKRPTLLLLLAGWAIHPATASPLPPPAGEEPPYALQGKRDPFQPPAGVEPNPVADGESAPRAPTRPKEPLEAFQLDSLKLVAILRSREGWPPAAMVQDPQGKGHLIRIGYHIGMREGVVAEIGDGVVILHEPPPTPNGTPRIITLRLQEEKSP